MTAGNRTILIFRSRPCSRMAPPANAGRARQQKALLDTATELLAAALADGRDFIITTETDEETGKKRIHVMTGQFVSACMLRKLIGRAESQKDEGSVLLTAPVRAGRLKVNPGRRP